MILFVLMNQKLEYLTAAKTLIRRLMFTSPLEKVQIATVSSENVVDTEPENISPPSIELINFIDQLIEKLLSCEEPIEKQEEETKLKVGFQVILQMIASIKENELSSSASSSKSKKMENKSPIDVVMFTNLQNAKFSENYSNKIIDEYTKENIRVCILTENISYPIAENVMDECLPELMKDPSVLASELAQLHHFIIQTNSFIGNINFGTSLFENVKDRKLPQTWNVNFRIGSKITIALCGYRKTVPYEEPKWYNRKRIFKNDDNTTFEPRQFRQDLDDDVKDESKEILYDVHTTNEGNEGFLTKEEKKAHKPKTVRCLDLLFTMDKNEIHEIHHEKPTYIFKPNTKKQADINAFNAFTHALVQHNLVGVARKCYNKNNYPKLVVLRPFKVLDNIVIESFLLPFKDHCVNPLDFINGTTRLWQIPNKDYQLDSTIEINAEIQEHVNDYLKTLTFNEHDLTKIIPPQLQFNPKLDYLYQIILNRAKCETTDESHDDGQLEIMLSGLHVKNLQPEFLKTRAANALNNLILEI